MSSTVQYNYFNTELEFYVCVYEIIDLIMLIFLFLLLRVVYIPFPRTLKYPRKYYPERSSVTAGTCIRLYPEFFIRFIKFTFNIIIIYAHEGEKYGRSYYKFVVRL